MAEEEFEVIKAEKAIELSKSNPARQRILMQNLKKIDSIIRRRASDGFRKALCFVDFDGFDLERAIVDNLPGYAVSFPQKGDRKIEVVIEW